MSFGNNLGTWATFWESHGNGMKTYWEQRKKQKKSLSLPLLALMSQGDPTVHLGSLTSTRPGGSTNCQPPAPKKKNPGPPTNAC